MGWSAIIAVIIQTLGPVLMEWLKKWLESRLQKAAGKLGEGAGFLSESAQQGALFDQAIDDLPRFALVRRMFLRSCRQAAVNAAENGGALRGADAAMLKDVASVVDELD